MSIVVTMNNDIETAVKIDRNNRAMPSTSIGSILVYFRNLFSLSQGELSSILGVHHRQQIGLIENGDKNHKIPFEILYRLITVVSYLQENEEKFNLNIFQRDGLKLVKMQLTVYLESNFTPPVSKIDNLFLPNS